MLSPEKYHSGISGLQVDLPRDRYPAPFQGASRLEYYASLFNSIEINSIFYQLPKPATIIKWASLVPRDFQFTFKLSKAITHVKELAFNEEDVRSFMTLINEVGDKRGCILIQFPPKLGIENMNAFHELVQAVHHYNTDWKLAVEFRNKNWYEREVYELLEEVNATLVVHDIPKSATPMIPEWSDHLYFRFHGPEGTYRGSYPIERMRTTSLQISELLQKNKQVYCYFNNTAGAAVSDLHSMNNMISGST